MGIDASAVGRAVGIDVQYKDLRAGTALFLAQHIAIIAQGSTAVTYPLTPWEATSAAAGGARFGYGSQIHLALRELFPIFGGGVSPIRVTVWPLADDGAGVAAAGSITPSGAATEIKTYWARVAGILSAPFTTAAGDSVATICDKIVAAVNAVLEMPMLAADGTTDVDLAAKWKGASGNDLTVEVIDATGNAPVSGVTFAIVQPAAGAADPSVVPALAMLGSAWVTMVINALGPTNTTALGLIAVAGEGRWDKLVRKPFVAFVGNPEAVVGTATTVPAARTADRVNVQLVAPGSVHLPVQIAAAQVREIAKVANNNPPTDYGGRAVKTLIPGADNLQWDYAERELAVTSGSSTADVKDGHVQISDVVTMYRPTGEVPPAYRHVVDIVKLQNIIYNFDLEFSKPEWNGAPLIPDGQPTANPNARTPKAAKARACSIIDGLALQAIISDPAAAKKATVASVDSQNPKRLNLSTTVQLAGNTNILSVDLNFGFFFGTAAAV
jgi:phage tail sheath gpL-like